MTRDTNSNIHSGINTLNPSNQSAYNYEGFKQDNHWDQHKMTDNPDIKYYQSVQWPTKIQREILTILISSYSFHT
jgi:hypothetical protein